MDQYDSAGLEPWWQCHLESVPSLPGSAGDRAHNREPHEFIEFGWAKYESRPATGLLMTGLRIEFDPG
jgi:hypothetical protein